MTTDSFRRLTKQTQPPDNSRAGFNNKHALGLVLRLFMLQVRMSLPSKRKNTSVIVFLLFDSPEAGDMSKHATSTN